MIGWLKRAGVIVMAAVGLLFAGILAIGMATNVGVALVQFVIGLPVLLWVAVLGFGGVLAAVWWFTRRA